MVGGKVLQLGYDVSQSFINDGVAPSVLLPGPVPSCLARGWRHGVGSWGKDKGDSRCYFEIMQMAVRSRQV